MPMKAECMSLVCRMVKVFLPSAAARSLGSTVAAATAAEPARNSRRARASIDIDMLLFSLLRTATDFRIWPVAVICREIRRAYFCGLPNPWFSIRLPSPSLDMTSSRLKLAAFWRCGYSLKLARNCPT